MKTIYFSANSRGYADYGWLKTNYYFSFSNYYNPERIHFGKLRVVNDDSIAGGNGFSTHPHDNMEIITIPFSGELIHKDNMGNTGIISQGEIQVMSAGSGITHSEFNNHPTKPLELFQIWIFSDTKNVTPRYQQISIHDIATENSLYQILSPTPHDQGVWIHQQAWMHMGSYTTNTQETYSLNHANNGVFAIVLSGSMNIETYTLQEKDAIGIWETPSISFRAHANSQILIIEIPM